MAGLTGLLPKSLASVTRNAKRHHVKKMCVVVAVMVVVMPSWVTALNAQAGSGSGKTTFSYFSPDSDARLLYLRTHGSTASCGASYAFCAPDPLLYSGSVRGSSTFCGQLGARQFAPAQSTFSRQAHRRRPIFAERDHWFGQFAPAALLLFYNDFSHDVNLQNRFAIGQSRAGSRSLLCGSSYFRRSAWLG